MLRKLISSNELHMLDPLMTSNVSVLNQKALFSSGKCENQEKRRKIQTRGVTPQLIVDPDGLFHL